MKVILTGGAGFIGSHTAIELVNEGYSLLMISEIQNHL